jgi:hypothetical protein
MRSTHPTKWDSSYWLLKERSTPVHELAVVGIVVIALLGIIPSASTATECDPATVTGTPGNDKGHLRLEGGVCFAVSRL